LQLWATFAIFYPGCGIRQDFFSICGIAPDDLADGFCFRHDRKRMIGNTTRNMTLAAAILMAGILAGCGTSTFGPDGGSPAQTMTGVSPSGYPGGQPTYAGSPALGSSSESKYAREEKSEAETPAEKSKK
jgi:hypothetical protein